MRRQLAATLREGLLRHLPLIPPGIRVMQLGRQLPLLQLGALLLPQPVLPVLRAIRGIQ